MFFLLVFEHNPNFLNTAVPQQAALPKQLPDSPVEPAKQKPEKKAKGHNTKEKPKKSSAAGSKILGCPVSWSIKRLQPLPGPLLQRCENTWKAGLERLHGKEGERESQVEDKEKVKP